MNADTAQPLVVVLAGPNGAGQSTAAPALLRDTLEVSEFVNADVIASGLSGFRPEEAAFAAGRVMFDRLRELAALGRSIAFETTLASRAFVPFLASLKQRGYQVHLLLLTVEGVELSVARVAERVSRGGHSVSEDIVRRRFARETQKPILSVLTSCRWVGGRYTTIHPGVVLSCLPRTCRVRRRSFGMKHAGIS